MRLAEEAIRKSDYEGAARSLRYVSICFGLVNDSPKRKEFARKAGECYLQAAKVFENKKDLPRAVLLCIKATGCFRESGSEELDSACDALIRKHHTSIVEEGSNSYETISDLKSVADYFTGRGASESAVSCYRMAAEKAYERGKVALSAGLYVDVAGRCRALEHLEMAAENYGNAAGRYFECERHFEAARYYCESGFLYIRVRDLDKAHSMAGRAGTACVKGQIDVILNDLTLLCLLLSKGDLQMATDLWRRIRRKFRRSIVELIDSCFEVVKQIQDTSKED
jgi:tetratricopeptide (TPR) repeat protein